MTDSRYRKIWDEFNPIDPSKRSLILKRYKERASLKCVYLGDQLEESASCGCAGAVKHSCKIHKECRRFGSDTSGIKICRDCNDYSSSGSPIVDGVNDPIPTSYSYSGDQQTAWNQEDAAMHLEALTRVLESDLGKPKECSGRGIIYVGGGAYWPGIVVGIRMLRELGCNLPIEVWHQGDNEPVNLDDIEGLSGIEIKDILDHDGHFRKMAGWEAKLYAIANSKFEQVLFLDADAYCVKNPEKFMDQQVAPFEFWEDLHANENTVRWNVIWPSGNGGVPPVQGGQLLINRAKAWKLIVASHWMCQHSDWYFKHMFGDQDSWRVVLSAIGDDSLWAKIGDSPWIGVAFVLKDREGESLIVHRCQGKLFSVDNIPEGKSSYTSPKYGLPMESRVFQILAQACKTKELNPASQFKSIYKNKLWGNGSGPGSTEEVARVYSEIINKEIKERNIKKVVDLGSGDGVVVGKIDADEVVGFDCYKTNGIIKVLDFYNKKELIPDADCYTMKDVLHHWSNNMIANFLEWWISEKKGLLFCTQDSGQNMENDDCPIGGYRPLNASMLPLSKFKPVKVGSFNGKDVLMFGK